MSEYIKQLKEAKQIWVYGAGIVGKRVVNVLQNVLNDKFAGIVVTKRKEKEFGINGVRIFELNELQISNEEVCFIIAVDQKYCMEIEINLINAGYSNYLLWTEDVACDLWKIPTHTFMDRRKKQSKVCFVLCGYKDFLWKNVFQRLEKFLPQDIEVCLVSSGVRHIELEQIAEKKSWSYLSSKRNSVTLVQNIAFAYYTEAEWVYKMDEDMFITEHAFEGLYEIYLEAEKNSVYDMGFVAPLIPINGYGYIQILKKLNLLDAYESKFGKAKCGVNPKSAIENNINAAMYMWGKDGIPQLDKLNRMFKGKLDYSFCNVRFSIGFILLNRKMWSLMYGFSAGTDPDMGVDEIELCELCMNGSRAIVVAENTVVGHFSFGRQTEAMRECYEKYPEIFALEDK